MTVKAKGIITVVRVDDGNSGIIVSVEPPEKPEPGQLWQTASGQPIKRWDGGKWALHYISVENINAETLSAITANIGVLKGAFSKSLKLPTGETVDVTGEITLDNGLLSGIYTWDGGFENLLKGSFSVDPDGIRGETTKVGTGRYSYEYGYEGIKIRNGPISVELDANDLQSMADREWEAIGEVSGTVFNNNIHFNPIDYTEIMLTVGTFDGNVNSSKSNRVLASMVMPVSMFEKTMGATDANGWHQAYYSALYWAGLNYIENGRVGIRASGNDVIGRLFAR